MPRTSHIRRQRALNGGLTTVRSSSNHSSSGTEPNARSSRKSSSSFAVLGLAAVFCLASVSLLPILFLDHHPRKKLHVPISVHNLIQKTEDVVHHKLDAHQRKKELGMINNNNNNNNNNAKQNLLFPRQIPQHLDEMDNWDAPDYAATHSVARGVAGVSQAPAVADAHRGQVVDCDVKIDSLAYWNDPTGSIDAHFESPFRVSNDQTKYITFSPDRGGWNNIRMSMEIIFVIAAVTGRTLVLPPKEPLYLLHHDKGAKYRGFGDFFPLESAEFQKRVPTISMDEFVKRKVVAIPAVNQTLIADAADHCEKRKKGTPNCLPLVEWLNDVGTNTGISATQSCVVFDEDAYNGRTMTDEAHNYVHSRCGKRNVVYWKQEWSEPTVLHFHADEKEYRLLTHFYNMLHFTDVHHSHHYKRFVRDFLHYHDSITCAAGKIVKAVQHEAQISRGHTPDPNTGAGGFAALHVRRGDLQYKRVKIPASEWYENTKELYLENELLYIATDERNKTFFDDLAQHHDLRYLDDYWELAGLSQLDPNYMGMIDTIVASKGRIFIGTWFSTFSGYINRLRGYQGLSMQDSWYSFLPKKEGVHTWPDVDTVIYAYEYPDGWMRIDGDARPDKAVF